ncbi:hypothetical protein R1sor_007562 [Riccia sorocarpa]|uniref:NADH dehydrogenase [ubiquinone] 1 beta subcomplex subunit 7 n=1 Tax=Riccia sorocarpa TaxID=122646 RepID=A0ABD3HUZ2_9MARC
MGGKEMIATQEEMVKARVPMGSRDFCAHLLIPLNKCRLENYYLPWKCVDERHSYEKCEYEIFLERMHKMKAIREAVIDVISYAIIIIAPTDRECCLFRRYRSGLVCREKV